MRLSWREGRLGHDNTLDESKARELLLVASWTGAFLLKAFDSS